MVMRVGAARSIIFDNTSSGLKARCLGKLSLHITFSPHLKGKFLTIIRRARTLLKLGCWVDE